MSDAEMEDLYTRRLQDRDAEIAEAEKQIQELGAHLAARDHALRLVGEHAETVKGERDQFRALLAGLKLKHRPYRGVSDIDSCEECNRASGVEVMFELCPVNRDLADLDQLAPADPDSVTVSRADLRRYFDSDSSDPIASMNGLQRLWVAAGIEDR